VVTLALHFIVLNVNSFFFINVFLLLEVCLRDFENISIMVKFRVVKVRGNSN